MSHPENISELPEHEYKEGIIEAGCLSCNSKIEIDFSLVEEHILPDAEIDRILQADSSRQIAGSARLSNIKCSCGGDLNIAVIGTDGVANINPNPN